MSNDIVFVQTGSGHAFSMENKITVNHAGANQKIRRLSACQLVLGKYLLYGQ